MESSSRYVVVAALVLGLVGSLDAVADEPPPEAAVVLVTGRHFTGAAGGNGFVIGNGALVATCAHLGFEKSAGGGHRAPTLLTVFSPYLGEACEARIVASEEELDLAVLEIPWQSHPENEFGHHSFASFLAHYRPELRTEALNEARAALRVHDGSAADRAKVEQLIQDLEAKGP